MAIDRARAARPDLFLGLHFYEALESRINMTNVARKSRVNFTSSIYVRNISIQRMSKERPSICTAKKLGKGQEQQHSKRRPINVVL